MADRMERENYVFTQSPQPSTSGIIVPKTVSSFTLPPSSFPSSFQIQTTLGSGSMMLTNSSETSAVYTYNIDLMIYSTQNPTTVNNYSTTPTIPTTISTTKGIAKLASTFATCQIFTYDGVYGYSLLSSQYASPQTIPPLPNATFILDLSGSMTPTTYSITNQTQSITATISYTCLYELTPSHVSSDSPTRLRA
jgi:hypothetical protein